MKQEVSTSKRIAFDAFTGDSPDPLIRNLRFEYAASSVTPVADCMNHVAERQENGDILCTHYFKCSCPNPVINPTIL
jgi:hypothetical protein